MVAVMVVMMVKKLGVVVGDTGVELLKEKQRIFGFLAVVMALVVMLTVMRVAVMIDSVVDSIASVNHDVDEQFLY